MGEDVVPPLAPLLSEEDYEMWAREKALALVLLTALSILPLGTLGGNNTQQTEGVDSKVYMLSFADSGVMRVLPALNMEIMTDYGNGYFLVKGPGYSSSHLSRFGIAERDLSQRTMIRFDASQYEFDTSRGTPALPPYLTATDSDERIVQFIGPIKSEWVNAVESTGVELRDYTESYAYIGRMTDEQVAAIKALPFVGWVGQYEPAYKIQSELLTMAGQVPIYA